MFALAGWMFADLMLALVVVVLSEASIRGLSAPAPERIAAEVTTSPSAVPALAAAVATPPPPLPPAPSTVPLGLDPARVELTFTVPDEGLLRRDPLATEEMRRQMEAAFSGERFRGRHVGLVLTFGLAFLSDPDRGVKLARAVNEVLGDMPLFQGAIRESFLTFNPPVGSNVEVWVYLLALP